MNNPRIVILTVLAVTAVALATVSIFAYAYGGSVTTNTYPNTTASGTNGYYPNGMNGNWGGMMSGMMGGNWRQSSVHTQATVQNNALPLIGLVALIGAVVTGTGGAAYYLMGPKMRTVEHLATSVVESSPQKIATPYVSVSKTLTTEERKVLDVLVAHNGKYLQKYIRAETGLSRLKTHRIVSRLAERGIVTLERSGNTNEVHLSSWLQNKPFQNSINDKQAENQELMVEA
jgi:uncharacterized membrane protein